jgi:hypothetical protein
MTVDQAKASVRQLETICKIRPTAENCIKLATCYFILNDSPAALALAQLAFSKNSNNTTIALNLGLIMKDLGDHEGAERAFKVAFELAEEDEYVRLAYSESLLRRGKWQEAWPIFEDTRSTKEAAALSIGLPLEVRMWNGKQKVEQLVVIDEGGVGDRITYCRWLPKLTELGIHWKFYPFPELRGFFERTSWCGPKRLVGVGSEVGASHWTTTYSLPANFSAKPEEVPKLPEPFKPSSQSITKYTLSKKSLPVIGLCWQGDESRHGGRRVHSLTEGQAMRLVCKTDHLIEWVNLQYQHRMPNPIANVKFDTWEELAGLIANLDAVVSVETGPMCLADALGKPTFALLSSNSDWKFMETGGSPFYPNTTLIRNGPGGGLENAIDSAINFLTQKYEKSKLVLVGG